MKIEMKKEIMRGVFVYVVYVDGRYETLTTHEDKADELFEQVKSERQQPAFEPEIIRSEEI